jgi:DNA polymerase-1
VGEKPRPVYRPRVAKERVILVDGSALVFRAFFAIPSTFATSGGVPTNATYGFALMFRKIFAGKKPAFGAVIFDAPGRTFRDEKYPKYKAQRPSMPSELRQQLPWIRRLVETQRFPMLEVPGFEADDVIGTLTRLATEAGHEVQVVSGDKDFAQLVSESVRMVDTMKDVSYDPELVRKKWGVRPERFRDLLALTGDKIDNVPGVPGIGPKTAIQLLEQFGDLEGILAHAHELKGKTKERLIEHADDTRLSKELVTIDTHVPLSVGLDDLRVPDPDPTAVDALYRELEFFSLLSGDDAKAQVADADLGALEADDVDAYFLALDAAAIVPVFSAGASSDPSDDDDSEGGPGVSGEPSPVHGDLVGVAVAPLSDGGESARYVPANRWNEAAKRWLTDPEKRKITHDLRDTLTILERHGFALEGVVGDTRLASFLIDPTRDIPHRLDQLVRRHLQRTLVGEDSVRGKGSAKVPLAEVPLEKLAPYAAHLAAAVAELWPVLEHLVDREGQRRYLDEIELPLSRVLARMQRVGIGADGAVLEALGREFEARRDDVEKEVHQLAGRAFNLGSAKQLGEVLFDELKLPVLKRTKTGYSTAADVLERLAPKHAIVAQILRWRALAKLVNTYTRVLREAIADDGRIHCRIQQTVGASGRLITTDPDLQRTPIRTDDGKRIREAFVPRAGWVLISADWSQIELRILAHVTQDTLLLEAFREGIDVHRRTASQIYGVAAADVTPMQRNVGKTVNFATIYGQGATALAQSLDLPRKEAKQLIDRYFEAYAGVRRWLDATVAEAHGKGYVETLMNRRRYVPELSSRDPTERSYGERIATNTPIQGSAADLCKLAMLDVAKAFADEGVKAEMLLQIHDELLFECPPEEVERVEGIVRRCMENALALDVPLVVDVGHGASWADAKA